MTTKTEPREVWAGDLMPGVHTVVNRGLVTGVRAEGAFVHVDIEGRRWLPTQGTHGEDLQSLFLHSTDGVWVTGGLA